MSETFSGTLLPFGRNVCSRGWRFGARVTGKTLVRSLIATRDFCLVVVGNRFTRVNPRGVFKLVWRRVDEGEVLLMA